VQYWIRKSLVLGVITALSGCSVFINNAHDEKNYRVSEQFKVPADLQKPYQDPEYVMTPAQYSKAMPSDIVKPPAQVLNVATGSWVEEGDKQTRIFFDKSDGIDDLKGFMWTTLNDLLDENKVAATDNNEAKGELSTDWYSIHTVEDVWFWEEEKEVSKQKFKFTIEQKEHQRTASMSTELLDFQSNDETLTPILRQQLEAGALNAFVSQFDFKYRQLTVEMHKQQGIVSLEMGFDNQGNAALVTEQSYEAIFERFSSFIEKLNFTINELDDEKGLITATYEKPDASVWDSIWGDDIAELPLESGQYQMLLNKNNSGGTSITWMDEEGETLEPGTMNDLQQALVKVLRKKGINI
jgi:outer membrane protein assembly factor BamC